MVRSISGRSKTRRGVKEAWGPCCFTHRTPEAFGKDLLTTCLLFGCTMYADLVCTSTVASVDKLGAGAALPVHSCSGVAALHHDEQQ